MIKSKVKVYTAVIPDELYLPLTYMGYMAHQCEVYELIYGYCSHWGHFLNSSFILSMLYRMSELVY